MNLLTLLRCNLYTQKEMGDILNMNPGRVSKMVCRLEKRGIILVHRSLVQSGKTVINGMNLHQTTLYRRRQWDLEKSLLIAARLDNLRSDGRGVRHFVTVENTGCQVSSAPQEKSPSTAKQTVSVLAKISGWIWKR